MNFLNPQTYIDFALAQGAEHAVEITIDQIAFDSRTYLKCLFGCSGGNPATPCHSQPGRIKPWEYEPMLKKYKWGILIHSKIERITQDISLALEGRAFADGYYFAFSLSDCALCAECAHMRKEPCPHYEMTRPSMHAAGIDVFKTVRNLKLPLEALKAPWSEEDLNFYSLVLVE